MPMSRLRRPALHAAACVLLSACVSAPLEPARPVRFVGASSLPAATLRAVVAAALAEAGEAAAAPDATLRHTASDAIARAYRARGHTDVAVVGATEADGTWTFTIVEGRRWTLASIDVEGATAVPRDELRRLWRLAAPPPGEAGDTAFTPGEPFDTERLDRWARLVGSRYVDAGYLDARFDVPHLARDDATGSVRITLRIAHEGPRYRIRAFAVPDALRALLGDDMPDDPAGAICTRAVAEGFAAAVLAGLRRRGHPQPELRIAATRDAERGEVTLQLTVEAGPPRTVSEVQVTGNRRVPADLIRDKLGLRPGQMFDGDAERRGVAALSATGEFRAIDVHYEPLADDRVRVVVDAQETSGLVLKGAPYLHPWRRLGYNLFVEGRDALGERHDLLGHVHVGHRGYHFAGRYLRSGLFDDANTALSLGGDFYYNERPAFTDRGAGGTVELRRYFAPGLSVAASYSALEHFATTFDARATTTAGRDYTEGRVSLLLDFDRTDNRLLPTRGERAFVRADRVDDALGADVEFTRLRVGAGVWLPLAEDLRWSVEGDAGWLWPGAGSAAVPIPERFFLGGYDTVRSFRQDRLGPRDASGALRGGEFRTFARSELVLRAVTPLDVALFADAGSVGTDVADFDVDDLRYAVGAALRLAARETGPVVISAAWNPDRERGEDEWVVDFAAGVIF